MRKGSTLILLCAGLVIGCSNGGSDAASGANEQVQAILLGAVRCDMPTTMAVDVVKPVYREGVLELLEPPVGPFMPAEGTLPMAVEEGQVVRLWVTFTPPAVLDPTVQEGTIRLMYRVPGLVAIPMTLRLEGDLETASAEVPQSTASAGDVVVGETGKFGFYVINTCDATPITVADVTPPDGDFVIAPDAFHLPAEVAPASRFFVRLEYTPHALGASSSVVQVYTSASKTPIEVTLRGTGVEQPTAQLVQTDVSAGKVVVGDKVELGVDFQNTSTFTTVKVTGLSVPVGEFSVAPDAPVLPADVGPGQTLHLPILYTPQGAWNASAVVHVANSVTASPLEATVGGTGIEARLVTYYDVWLDSSSFESYWQYINVPAEAVGIYLEATGESWSCIDLIGFEGPSGTVYENYDMTGPLGWLSNYPAGGYGYLNVQVPNSDLPDVQLESGGGMYGFRLRDSWAGTDHLQVRVTVVQRTGGAVEDGTLDLRVFLANGLGINPYYAMSDAKVNQMVTTVDAILGESGIRLGKISFFTLDPYYDTMWDQSMTEGMLANCTAGFPDGALNLFLVSSMDYGVSSVSGAVPGPTANGTRYSGVVIDFNAMDAIPLGAMAAHQIVHYLGVETEQVVLEQGGEYAALRHPLLHPRLPDELLSPPESTNYDQIFAEIDQMPAMDTWCGTCGRPPVR
ncbi:MAG TPA: hypothetical protein VFY93_15155 [Planctomycetota bacterium]|nr:hypothetical protein [Planctomycetota bacterium]